MKRAVNTQEVKRYNKNRIYRHLLAVGRTSRQALSQALGLSMPTVLQNTRELEEVGLLSTDGSFASTGGRKAQVMVPVRDTALAVGMDVTRNHIGLVVADLCGNIVRQERVQLVFADTEAYSTCLRQQVAAFLKEFSEHRLLGAAIILPGIVSRQGDRVKHSHVLGLKGNTTRFEGIFSCPTRLCNDSNAAAFAEFHGRQARAVYLSLSNSVGGAIYERELIEGNHCHAGEFGHMTLVPEGERCYCGRYGCADAYLAAPALTEDGRLADFFAAVEKNDASATQQLMHYLDLLSVLVNNLQMAFDSEVMLGGYIGGFLEPYWTVLEEKVRARSTFPEHESGILPCRYRVEAAALGGALQFIEAFIETI